MKTVKDAYRYNKNIKIDSHHTHICFNTKREDYFALYASDTGENTVVICTIKQYKDYAKIQKLNSINKEAVKPVYTQEMADNGELPPVGSKVILNELPAHYRGVIKDAVGREVWVLGYHREHLIIHWSGCYDALQLSWFKPIDTRTDEEKLIDEVAELINDHIDDDAGSKCLAKEIINKLK